MEKKKIFFKNLDSWRFIAFFSVFLYHGLYSSHALIIENPVYIVLKKLFSYGHLGVNLFFVLSGFLITYLLLVEESISSSKRYNVFKFWGRRVLRIWPLYFMVIIFSFVFFVPLIKLITGKESVEIANIFYYLFFIPNFQLAIDKVFPLSNTLTVLWSVGVEEQFYLFWPLLFFIKKLRLPVIVIIILGSIVFRYFNAGEIMVINYHTFSVMGVLGIGCLLALFTVNKKIQQSSIRINKFLNASIYTVFILSIYIYPIYLTAPIYISLSTTFTGLFFAYLIFEQVFVSNPIINLGKIKFLKNWGKYTYGLYCLHPIGILIAFNVTKVIRQETNIWWLIFGEMMIGLIFSMILAWFSYHLVEKHFLKLKDKISKISK